MEGPNALNQDQIAEGVDFGILPIASDPQVRAAVDAVCGPAPTQTVVRTRPPGSDRAVESQRPCLGWAAALDAGGEVCFFEDIQAELHGSPVHAMRPVCRYHLGVPGVRLLRGSLRARSALPFGDAGGSGGGAAGEEGPWAERSVVAVGSDGRVVEIRPEMPSAAGRLGAAAAGGQDVCPTDRETGDAMLLHARGLRRYLGPFTAHGPQSSDEHRGQGGGGGGGEGSCGRCGEGEEEGQPLGPRRGEEEGRAGSAAGEQPPPAGLTGGGGEGGSGGGGGAAPAVPAAGVGAASEGGEGVANLALLEQLRLEGERDSMARWTASPAGVRAATRWGGGSGGGGVAVGGEWRSASLRQTHWVMVGGGGDTPIRELIELH